ncbi:hypothetical protein D3C75_425890 [compost metagenome]
MVRVERDFIPRLVHQPEGWHPAALRIPRGSVFEASFVAVVTHHHFLMTGCGGKQHAVIQDAKRVTQQPALRAVTRRGQRVKIVAAKVRIRRFWHGVIIINIGGWIFGRHAPRGSVAFDLRGIANVHFMRNRAGIEITAHPRHAAEGINNTIGIQTADGGIAVFIEQFRGAISAGFVSVLCA